MPPHSASLTSYLARVVRYRDLIIGLTARDFAARYRGSILGGLWAIISPLLVVLMFTFVFGVIFKARWGVEQVSDRDFIVIAMCGMIVHGLFVEVLGRSPTLVMGQPSYVKKVVFPLEILPVTALLSALINAAIMLVIVFVGALAIRGAIPVTALLLPVVWAPFLLLLLGVSLFLSSIGVYVRDLVPFVNLIGMASLFLAPIFYPMTAVPANFQWLLWLNPLTFIVEQTRAVMLFGFFPDWQGLAIYGAAALAFAWIGLWWFQRIRKGFADVI